MHAINFTYKLMHLCKLIIWVKGHARGKLKKKKGSFVTSYKLGFKTKDFVLELN